jgi:hypothetical protein
VQRALEVAWRGSGFDEIDMELQNVCLQSERKTCAGHGSLVCVSQE